MTSVRITIDRTSRGYPFLVKEQLNDSNEATLLGEANFLEAELLGYDLEEYFQEVKTYLLNYAEQFSTYAEESTLSRRDTHQNTMSLLRYVENYLEPKWAAEWQRNDTSGQ